jgi:hypothetical protein
VAQGPLNGFASAADLAAAQIANAVVRIGQAVSSFGDPSQAAGLAGGGFVSGPGSATSDSIPAWLSNGEFVINARATEMYLPLLHAINSMSFKPPSFSLGGLVSNIAGRFDFTGAPKFASGGEVGKAVAASGPTSTVNLSIDGHSFNGFSAPEKTAQSLQRFSVQRQWASNGAKPRYYR